ncbi:hypothetical protein [Novosphingobium sp. PhB165]|uniref:hypothetical protein n=1 Tax=Novosphingobium sp. PhB165 TaxID=2485105 RepID=UPI001404AFB5|nr:hypothetical protein [Novosphingobium sp. PhB165]
MVETRYQILTFWMIAAALGLWRHAEEPQAGSWRAVANAAAATAAIIAMKWHIEGVSPLLLPLMV